jgi:hypothetical protein
VTVTDPARLHPADIEAIASRSAELVLEALGRNVQADRPTLVDAAGIAAQFGVDRSWVYDHADELGAVRLGDGPRPRLRFDPATVMVALDGRNAGDDLDTDESPDVASLPGRRRRNRPSTEIPLLPIRDQAA